MPSKTFGQRLRLVRSHYKITITDMSKTLKVVKSNISRYERDLNQPTVGFLGLLLKHYRVNLNWLFGEKQDMILPAKRRETKNAEMTANVLNGLVEYTSFRVPVFAGEQVEEGDHTMEVIGAISAGEPLEMREENYEFVPFPFYKTYKDLHNFLVFKVNGLSMAPDIHHEDIVFIHRNTSWMDLNGKIVAVNIHGDMTLKKLSINKNTTEVSFQALNRDYQDIVFDFSDMDNVSLVGELKGIRRIYH
ncbi:MAG: helix-turn-helix domain-containing protein [Candidatus Cloacimonetes bacterium]|nr:helix-turn-helix domain-containing protein [Candidatus Cloacimonadota bacterium]